MSDNKDHSNAHNTHDANSRESNSRDTNAHDTNSHDTSTHDPMHGVTLKMILTYLVDQYGWEELGDIISINCFTHEPSIHSSLKFLRRTPWARDKVEALYLRSVG